jgi:hypothetical protein
MSMQRHEVRTLPAGRDAVVDRWLARVARLGPAEWGRLDAIGQRFTAGDPMSRWQRADRMAAIAAALPALERALAVFGFGAELLHDLLGGARGARFAVPRPRDPSPAADPAGRRLVAQLQSLWDLGHAQPGGAGAAMSCLHLALLALHARPRMPVEAFARLYALVEPVVPVREVEP